MAFPRIGGPGVGLDLGNLGYGVVTLGAGETMWIPSGTFQIVPGPYTLLQYRDPVSGIFRTVNTAGVETHVIGSDGYNWRLANLTGCPIGATISNVGSAYTSLPAVAASAGNSTWTPIIGGAINATVTVTAAGSGYLYPPILLVQAPGLGGLPCTMVCTALSSGTIIAGNITVVNQGAGYAVAPKITVLNDPRDTAGSGATVTCALTGGGTLTGLMIGNHGTPLTAVPTLSFSGGGGSSAAATVVMCFTATGISGVTAGTGYGNAQPFGVLTVGGQTVAGGGATVNPTWAEKLLVPRMANIQGTSTAGGGVTATGLVIADGGLFSAVPGGVPVGQGSGGVAAITVGGATDTTLIQTI